MTIKTLLTAATLIAAASPAFAITDFENWQTKQREKYEIQRQIDDLRQQQYRDRDCAVDRRMGIHPAPWC